MTIEEKAKAYDDAIKEIRELISLLKKNDVITDNGIIESNLQRIFPQLNESDDERIRKALIWHLKADVDFVSNGVTKAECIAYLEKQKEQKHPNGCFTCDEYKKGYEEGRRNGFTAGYNKAMKEVEQKEQKPVVTHGETYRVDTLGTQQVIAGKMPQKLAEWSEEDEGELQNAIDALEFLGKKGVYKSESGYDAALQAASWLKNLSLDLKKRNEDVTKLCSNEWSEEDEEIFNNIIEKAKGGHWIEVNEITWLIAWFKSLRLQPKQE